MSESQIHAVTGAFGYSGRYITRRLLAAGKTVITLTNSPPKPGLFDQEVRAYPLSFDDPAALADALRGVDVLYNTYWVRFNHQIFTHETAVQNTFKLFAAAQQAGVRRIVHVSITNPSLESPLEYFSGKARIEQRLIETGLSYAMLRPTVLFGKEDILINNIAWMLRRLPVFGVFGDGAYRLQPIYVDDLARLAVEHGATHKNIILNAIGPETFTYRELVHMLGQTIGHQRPILSVPPGLGYGIGAIMGKMVNDVTITREEIDGLMADLLWVDSPPTGTVKLTEWASQHAADLGKHYASELARRR